MNKISKLSSFSLLLCSINSLYGGTSSISLSGNPPTFTVNSAIAAGQGLASVTNTSTTWGCTNGSASQTAHVTGQLSAAVSAGNFQMELTAPQGTSAGYVTLSTTAQTLFSNLPANGSGSGSAVGYIFTANINGAQTTNSTVTLTLTLLNP